MLNPLKLCSSEGDPLLLCLFTVAGVWLLLAGKEDARLAASCLSRLSILGSIGIPFSLVDVAMHFVYLNSDRVFNVLLKDSLFLFFYFF